MIQSSTLLSFSEAPLCKGMCGVVREPTSLACRVRASRALSTADAATSHSPYEGVRLKSRCSISPKTFNDSTKYKLFDGFLREVLFAELQIRNLLNLALMTLSEHLPGPSKILFYHPCPLSEPASSTPPMLKPGLQRHT